MKGSFNSLFALLLFISNQNYSNRKSILKSILLYTGDRLNRKNLFYANVIIRIVLHVWSSLLTHTLKSVFKFQEWTLDATTDLYSKPCKTSKMELFPKIVNSFQPLFLWKTASFQLFVRIFWVDRVLQIRNHFL